MEDAAVIQGGLSVISFLVAVIALILATAAVIRYTEGTR